MKKRRKSKARNLLSSYQWKELRVKALNRDNHQCVFCGAKERLAVHHILLRATWPEYALNLNNLCTLCSSCHSRFKKRRAAHGDPVAWWLKFEQIRPEQAAVVKTLIEKAD